MPDLDIQAGITTAILIALVLMVLYIIGGVRSISASVATSTSTSPNCR